jgi:hypothetical protein
MQSSILNRHSPDKCRLKTAGAAGAVSAAQPQTPGEHILEPEWKVERRSVAALIPYARNARTHSPEQVDQIAASIREWGWTIPVLVDEAGGIIAGHGRILAAHRLGIEDVPVMVAAGWSDAKKRAYMLADNKLTLNGEWDLDRLAIEIAELRASDFDISLIGFSESEIDDLLKADGGGDATGAGALAERFMVPPFSVLNAREGWWQARKAAWLALGIQSELGRGENMPGGPVLGPFAGGSVRGIVAAKCGRRYIGIDLSARQVAANRAQAEAICGGGKMPVWARGDAADLAKLDCAADFVFSCPPYGDLEVYSDHPR